MNRFTSIVLAVTLLLGLENSVQAQSREQVLSEIRASMMSADAVGLARQTVSSVEIALFGEGRFYSRGQATLLLKEFFSDFPPDEFKIVNFTQTPSAWFLEGAYQTKASKTPIPIFMRLRGSNGVWKIRELLIEEADG